MLVSTCTTAVCIAPGNTYVLASWGSRLLSLWRLCYLVSVYLQAVLPEMLRPGTASPTVAEEGSDQMQAVQPGTQQQRQQQQQQQARQHSGPYGLLDEQDVDVITMNDSVASAPTQQQESQPQQQARQRSGPYGLPHDQGGSSTATEDSAAPQQVSSCFQYNVHARSRSGCSAA